MPDARRRKPWELIGLAGVLAVFALGAVLWFASPRGRGELSEPSAMTLALHDGLESGLTEEGRPYLGPVDAAVSVTEIADFQCPFCRTFAAEDFAAFVRDYVAPGDVRWVVYLVGFDGSESSAAAIAAHCAGRQDAFWTMHDWLYANAPVVIDSGAFSRERLLEIAERLALDTAGFEACLDDPAVAALVLDNERYARQLGVTASPTFVVGDRLVEGRDVGALRGLIDAALRE